MSRSLLLLLAVFLVSTAALFAHRALAETTPLALAAWRLGLAAVCFLGWSAVQRKALSAAPTRWPRTVWLRLTVAGLCLAGHFLVWFVSLQETPVARATLLVCTTPLWALGGSLLLGRRRTVPWPALILAVAGIVLVTGAGGTGLAIRRGDVLAALGGALFAAYLLAMEGIPAAISAGRQVTATYTVAALVLWLVLLVREGLTVRYSPAVWAAIAGMTLGPQIVGHTLLNWSLRHFPSSTVAFSILLEPVLAAWLAWLLLGQRVTPGQGAGGLLVLVGLALVIWRQAPAERLADEPVG